MTSSHAAPESTIAHAGVLTEAQGFMIDHRAEAQRIIDRELAHGEPLRKAVLKAGRSLRAARRAQIMHRAELPHRIAASASAAR